MQQDETLNLLTLIMVKYNFDNMIEQNSFLKFTVKTFVVTMFILLVHITTDVLCNLLSPFTLAFHIQCHRNNSMQDRVIP